METTINLEDLRCAIKREYTEVATHPEKGFHFHTGHKLARMLEYPETWLERVPKVALESFAGTGNPFKAGDIRNGANVVDAGCGSGFDSTLAGIFTGRDGAVIGVDMTPGMLKKARTAASQAGLTHVEFRDGYLEELPVADGWADVVISNGVLNLCPDKLQVLREFHRVLAPSGRLQVGDILVEKPVPEKAKQNMDLWTG